MRQYKVGDQVTLRSWESMEREFGLNENGSVNILPFFTEKMKEYCGKQSTILSNLRNNRYELVDCGLRTYGPQMFTDWEADWEADNAKETKMQYNGQEVELITDGYWPEGETLICSDDGNNWSPRLGVVCLHDEHVFYKNADVGVRWKYWALIPANPAPRRLTNREVANLCKKGWDTADGEWIYLHWHYKKEYENDPTPQGVTLRAPNSDEWLEPTSELLEVWK